MFEATQKKAGTRAFSPAVVVIGMVVLAGITYLTGAGAWAAHAVGLIK